MRPLPRSAAAGSHRAPWRRPGAAGIVLLALLVSACARPGNDPEALAEVIGRVLTIPEVEARLRSEAAGNPEERGSSQGIDWPGRYREAAEALALEHLLLADLQETSDGSGEALVRELGGEYPRLVCDTVLELYLPQLLGPEVAGSPGPAGALQPSEEEIDAFHEAHREAFERPEQRLAWHLFLRFENHGGEEATLAQLEELKQRAEGGESFRSLARAHSDSENRKLGGHLGWVVRGSLPPDLEEVVFSLATSGTSGPLPTADGAFLVHVSDMVPGVNVSETEARRASAGRLRELALLDYLEQLASEVPRENDWLLLGEAEIPENLARSNPGQEILRVGEVRLTAADLFELLESIPARAIELGTAEERIRETYRLQAARLLLCRQALDGAFFDDPARREVLDDNVFRLGRARLLDLRLEQRIGQRIDRDPEALERFYADNRHLYQSPLRLLVRGLALAPEPRPDLAMARLRQIRDSLERGALDLDGAIAKLRSDGFETQSIEERWLDPPALSTLAPKIRAYLTQLSDTGYTVPFHQNGLLQLLQVAERQEPSPLPFADARERVRRGYYQRHRQRLFRELESDLLEKAGFRFHAESLRLHLDTLGLGASAGSDA
ncbi:MAG: peptidyl-prolyl cis-trans isomerase [Holophagales bacterium]|nr:peptidyl-prolyl cis-trans isomerase [Holophagales bacterium]